MRLTAYTYNRVWNAWDGVDTWIVGGSTLTMWRTVSGGRAVTESVTLPREVVGLADDSPPRPVSGAWAPTPPKPATSEPRPPRIPPRERPSEKERRRW